MKILITILSIIMYCTSYAATYYVRTDGNNANTGLTNSAGGAWATIAYAVANATSNGDIIRIVAGTHTVSTQCDLAVGVSIEGDGKATTTINSTQTGDWSVFLQLQSADETNGNQHITGVTLNGGYVSAANVKTWVCFWITGRSNVQIYDCDINNWKQTAIIFNGINTDNPGQDTSFVKATGNKVYNCDILNCSAMYNGTGQGALMIGFQEGFEIYGCLIQQDQRPNFENGWPIKYWNQGWLDGCKIYNNTLIKIPYSGDYPGENGNWDFAIELFSIKGLQIYGNNIQNGAIDLNYNYKGSYDFSVWIHDNTIENPVFNPKVEGAIILEFRTEYALIENNIINNKAYGVSFNTRAPTNKGGDRNNFIGGNVPGGYSYLVGNIIRENLFTNIYLGTGIGNTFAVGIISEGTDDPQYNNLHIYNNTIVAKSGTEARIGFDFTSQPAGNGDSTYIQNNIIVGFANAWIQGSAGATNMDYVWIQNNNLYLNGASNLPVWTAGNPTNYTNTNNLVNSNPLFVGGTDYTLQAGSPCIEAGIDVGLPYPGSAPNIGYWQSASPPSNPGFTIKKKIRLIN